MNKPQNIIVHHSLTPKGLEDGKSEQSFNNTHKGRGFPRSKSGWYIGYHYIVYSDGDIRQYKDHDEVGAHCYQQGMNFKSIGVCLEGNFDVEEPNEAQKKALKLLIGKLQAEYNIPADRVVPHRTYAPKSCWGALLPDDIIGYLSQIEPAPHWSDKAMIWMVEEGLIKEPRSPYEPIQWGEFAVILKRFYEKTQKDS